jgi:hypothetical protein
VDETVQPVGFPQRTAGIEADVSIASSVTKWDAGLVQADVNADMISIAQINNAVWVLANAPPAAFIYHIIAKSLSP